MGQLQTTSLFVILYLAGSILSSPIESVDQELKKYLEESKVRLSAKYEDFAEALSGEDKERKLTAAMQDIQDLYREIYWKFKSYPRESITDEDILRIRDMWTHYKVEDINLSERLMWILNPMMLSAKGASPTFCGYKSDGPCDLVYVEDIQRAMAKSNDIYELLFYWQQWREQLGRDDLNTFFDLANLTKNFAERENELSSDLYYFYAGRDNFYQQLLRMHEEILPLYKHLHAYIRYQLRQKYGDMYVPKAGPIPQPLLDQIFAQGFKGGPYMYPYPDNAIPNLTENLIKNGYTGLKQLEVVNQFYESIGMPLPDGFKEEKFAPATEEHCFGAYVGDASEGFQTDYCPKVEFFSFLHEFDDMLQLRYKMKYSNLPMLLDREPCPGFTEALGISVKLSVLLPSYLKSVNALDVSVGGNEFEINRLYRLALFAVLAMPMHILHDKFWIEASGGAFQKNTVNMEYEKMLYDMTGVSMPPREKEYDLIMPYQFFRGLSYSKPATTQIFAEAMGYELYKSFCTKAGLYNPNDTSNFLKDCNFYGHHEVGNALNEIMSYGNRKDWWTITEPYTGKTELSGSGILDYFKPLHEWLEAENRKNSEPIGW